MAIVACSQAKAKAHNVCRIVEVVCGEDQIPLLASGGLTVIWVESVR